MAVSLSANVKVENGSSNGLYSAPVAFDSPAASWSWSKAGRFSRVAASYTMNWWPPFTDTRYQKRVVSPIHVAGPAMPGAASP